LVKEKEKETARSWTKFMIKLRARKEKRDQSISQYHPPLITDNRTKKKKRKQTGNKSKQPN